MPVIIIITLAIFCVLIIGTWHYLGNIEKTKKIVFIIIRIKQHNQHKIRLGYILQI